MIPIATGLVLLGGLFWAAGAFSRARVASVKTLLAWVAALAGLSVAALLFLTGRGALAISGLVLLGPLAWSYVQQARGRRTVPTARMTRQEALEVLGLQDGASDSDVRAAWVRIMRAAHPDGGGTDWLAARVNQAREVLLGRR